MQRRFTTAAYVLLLTCAALPAQAQQLSHYLAGLPSLNDLFLPPKEAGRLLYAQYNVYYHPNTLRDDDGKQVDSITFDGPLGNPRSVDLDIDVDLVFLVPTMVWAPDWEVLGARYGAYAALPVGNPSISATLETARGRGVEVDDSVWDIGDLFVQPIWLMWTVAPEGRRPQLDVIASYGFDAPTGRYEGGATDNVGLGFWEHQFQTGARLTLDEANATVAYVANTFETGHNKEDADVTPGAHNTVNWGFGRHFADGWFESAVLGYHSFQVTDDSGSDVDSSTKDEHDQVHGFGVQLGVPKLGLSLKYFREFCARDRFEGDLVTLTFSLPLDLLAQKLTSGS